MKIIRAVAVFLRGPPGDRKGARHPDRHHVRQSRRSMVPAMLPKLAVYLRGYFDVATKPQPINGWIKFPWGHRIDLGEATEELVEAAIRQAKAHKNPLAGVILKGMFSPFAVESFGVATAPHQDWETRASVRVIEFSSKPLRRQRFCAARLAISDRRSAVRFLAAPSHPSYPRPPQQGPCPALLAVGSRSGFSPVAISMVDLASWFGSQGRFGCCVDIP